MEKYLQIRFHELRICYPDSCVIVCCVVVRGSFGKFLIMTSLLHNALIKCYQIIHFWKLEFNGYLMVYFFFEKGLGVHVQSMLKMSRGLYTGGNFKQNTWKKAKENWGPYLRSSFDKLTIWCQLIFIKVYYAITACTTTTFTFGKCWPIEKW